MGHQKASFKSSNKFNPLLNRSSLFGRLAQLDNSSKYRLLVACALLFIIATLLALYQPLPKSHARANFEASHFIYPHENNPELRLPLINANITDIATVGDKIWLVGSGGLILMSSDVGRCWQQQGPWIKPAELVSESNDKNNQHDIDHLCQNEKEGLSRLTSSLAMLNMKAEQLSFFPSANASDKKEVSSKNRKKSIPANNNYQQMAQQSPDLEEVIVTGSKSNYQLETINQISTPDDYYPYFNSIQFANEDFGIAVANDGFIARTKDGGKTWEKIAHVGIGNLQAVAIDVSRSGNMGTKIIAVGSNGLVLVSLDRGDSWQRTSGFNNQRLNDVKIVDNAKIIIVGDNSFAYIYEQQDQQWKSNDIFFRGNLNTIALDQNDNIIIAGQAGKMIQASLQSLQFSDKKTNTQQAFSDLTYSKQKIVIAVTEEGTLIRSKDNGETWKNIVNPSDKHFYSVSFIDQQQVIAVGERGTITVSNDRGLNWTMMSRRLLPIDNRPKQQYSVNVAYWWYLVTFLCAGFVLLIIRPRIESDLQNNGIAGIAASDRPLQPGDPEAEHLLGIASDITAFLSNPKTTAPLTLAITGPWGCGKSSLMNLVKDELLKRRFSPVWFNAWHHQKGEQLLASLFAHIKQQAIPSWFSLDGLWFRIKLAIIRGRRNWMLFSLLLFISFVAWTLNKNAIGDFFGHFVVLVFNPKEFWSIQWNTIVPDSISAEGGWLQIIPSLLGLAAPLVALLKGIQGFGLSPEKLISVNHNSKGKSAYDPSARSRFANEFKDVTDALGNNKMVIFIDDLDRCSQDNLIEILENINFISSSGDCFLILGMAPKYIKACVANAYQTLANSIAEKEDFENNVIHDPNNADKHKFNFANQYLEKMINIEVNVPCLEEQSIAQMLNQQAIQEDETETERETLSFKLILDWFIEHSGPAIKLVFLFSVIYFGIDYGSRIPPREIEQTKPQSKLEYSVGYINQEDLLLLLAGDSPEIVYDVLAEVTKKPNDGKLQYQLFVQLNDKNKDTVYKIGSMGEPSKSLDLVVKIDPDKLRKQQIKTTQSILNDPPSLDSEDNLPTSSNSASSVDTNSGNSKEREENTVSTSLPASLQLTTAYSEKRLSISQLLVALLLFVLWIFYLKKRKKEKFSADSNHFKQALANWTPWIQLKQQTPRAIKRFLNHLRFQSIRNRDTLSEATLVAAASICFFEKNWLVDEQQFKQLVDGKLNHLLKQKLADESSRVIDKSALNRMVSQLQSSLSGEIMVELSNKRLAAVNILSENKQKRG